MESARSCSTPAVEWGRSAVRERCGSTCATCTRSKEAKASQVLGGGDVAVARTGLEKRCTYGAVRLRLFYFKLIIQISIGVLGF